MLGIRARRGGGRIARVIGIRRIRRGEDGLDAKLRKNRGGLGLLGPGNVLELGMRMGIYQKRPWDDEEGSAQKVSHTGLVRTPEM